jgi:hypothetical protein
MPSSLPYVTWCSWHWGGWYMWLGWQKHTGQPVLLSRIHPWHCMSPRATVCTLTGSLCFILVFSRVSLCVHWLVAGSLQTNQIHCAPRQMQLSFTSFSWFVCGLPFSTMTPKSERSGSWPGLPAPSPCVCLSSGAHSSRVRSWWHSTNKNSKAWVGQGGGVGLENCQDLLGWPPVARKQQEIPPHLHGIQEVLSISDFPHCATSGSACDKGSPNACGLSILKEIFPTSPTMASWGTCTL